METAPSPSNPVLTATSEAKASRVKHTPAASKVSEQGVSTYTFAFLDGGTFISARRLRIARIAVIMRSNSRSSAAKLRASSNWGHFATIRLSPSWGMDCQISSVIKGIKG